MKRALTVIGIVILLLGLAGVAAPYWLGMKTESAFNDAIKGLATRSGMPSKNYSFSRGWLRSEAKNEFNLLSTPAVITATHRIEHGPLPLSQIMSGEIAPALALIKTTLRLSATADASASLSESLNKLPPIRLTTILDLSGNGSSKLQIDAATRKLGETTVSWQAGSGKMEFDRQWKKIRAQIQFPSYSVSSSSGKLNIKNIQLTSEAYEGIAGYMFGKSNFSIASVSLKPFLDVKSISISAIAQPKGKFVTIHIGFGVKALQIAKDKYGPGKLSLVIRNLDAKTLKQFENDINKIYGRAMPKEQMQLMVAGKFMQYAGKLTRNNPEIEITKLGLIAPGGELQGKAKFSIEGKKQDLSANPMLMLTAIKGSAELTMPESLAKAVVMTEIQRDISNLKREGRLSNADTGKLTPEALNQIAEEIYPKYLKESGFGRWFVRQNNRYRFSMSVNRGQIIVNGAPLQRGR